MHHLMAVLDGKTYYICSALEEHQIDSFWALWTTFYPEAEFKRTSGFIGRMLMASYGHPLDFVRAYKKLHFLNETIGA